MKRKTLLIIFAFITITMVAAAGVFTYFGRETVNVTSKQSVTVDGHRYNQPIIVNVSGVGGDSISFTHLIQVWSNAKQNITISASVPTGIGIKFYVDGVEASFPMTLDGHSDTSLLVIVYLDSHLVEAVYHLIITYTLL